MAPALPVWAWGEKPAAELPNYVVEYNAVVRRAFVPRVVVRTYNAGPMLSLINPGKGYTSAPSVTVVGEPDGP